MAKNKMLSPISILMLVIILAALATWLIPAGKYDTLTYNEDGRSFELNRNDKQVALPFAQKTLDSLGVLIKLQKFSSGDIRKPVAIPGTYQVLPKNSQGPIEVIQAPLKGMYDSIDIILFLFMIGAFINVFYSTGAMEEGLGYLSYKMKGKESWLIITLTFLFSFGGSSFGMAEEGLAFYPIMVPLFIAAGYDLLVPVAVIFGGTQLGTLSSFSNPFSTIIASNAAGINWTDGLYGRLLMFVLSTSVFIWYVVRYADRVKKDPSRSLVLHFDGNVTNPFASISTQASRNRPAGKTISLLLLFACTFAFMISGVIFMHWWLLEMSAIFVVSSILIALIVRMNEKVFLEKFVKGAESMLGVGLIIAVARGVTIILNEGNVSDSIIFYSASLISHLPVSLFLVILLLLYMIFTLFISSTSGMAGVTMPIMGSLAVLVGVPGREIVNSYLFGMGIMGLVTPTGLILPSLALVNISIKAWIKFIMPLMLILLCLCALFLVIEVKL